VAGDLADRPMARPTRGTSVEDMPNDHGNHDDLRLPGEPAPRHRLRSAFGLLLLAPLVGEFLLGNQPITALPSLFLLAPMYGGGALLVREVARRTGRGWPAMLLFAAAYALIEEGPIDQMLWNPHYGGFDMGHAYGETYVPWLGTSVVLLQEVLSMHTVWSICVPIALVETFGGDGDRTRAWLGRPGLAVTGVAFAATSLFLAVAQQHSERFMASPAQFAGTAVAIAALLAVGFAVPRRPARRVDAEAPRPWVVGGAALAVAGLYWGRESLLPAGVSDWVLAGAWCVLAAGFLAVCARWTRSRGWGGAHRLALAGGALLTYVWVGFTQARDMGVPYGLAVVGNVVFGVAAVALLAVGALAVRARGRGRARQRTGRAVARMPAPR
jgi:hypothetical protein